MAVRGCELKAHDERVRVQLPTATTRSVRGVGRQSAILGKEMVEKIKVKWEGTKGKDKGFKVEYYIIILKWDTKDKEF